MKNIFKTYKTIYGQIIEKISDNSGFLLSLISGFLTILIIRTFLSMLDTIFTGYEFPIQRIVFMISTGLLVMGLEIGYTKFIFEKIDDKNRNLGFIFNHFHILGKYLKGLIIFYVIIFIFFLPCILFCLYKYGIEFIDMLSGMIMDPYFQELAISFYDLNQLILIISIFALLPAYIMIRLYFWSYFIIDQNLDGKKAIEESWKITKDRNFEILIFSIFIMLFNVLGILTIIGMCVTAPFSYLFLCLYFRHLNSK